MKRLAKLFIVVAIIGNITLLSGCGRKQININDYVVVTFAGYNTDGVAMCYLDYDKMIGDNLKLFKLSSKSSPEDRQEVIECLADCIDFKIDKEEDLQNGDEVKIKLLVDEKSLCKKYDATYIYEKISTNVKGLKGYEDYDFFDDIEVHFYGRNRYGSMDYINNSEYDIELIMEGGNDLALENGDIITLRVKSNDYMSVDDYIKSFMKVLVSESRQYKVTGLLEFLHSVNDLDTEQLNALIGEAKELIEWDYKYSEAVIDSLDYVGPYLVYGEGNNVQLGNALYLIFRIKAHNEYAEFTYYTFRGVKNVYVNEEGMYDLGWSTKISPHAYKSTNGEAIGDGFVVGEELFTGFLDFNDILKNYCEDAVINQGMTLEDNIGKIKNEAEPVKYKEIATTQPDTLEEEMEETSIDKSTGESGEDSAKELSEASTNEDVTEEATEASTEETTTEETTTEEATTEEATTEETTTEEATTTAS